MILPYEEAMHGIQSGVAFEISKGSNDTDPKHLRVGINSALLNDAAVAALLIRKGIFTENEYVEEVTRQANIELRRYEERIRERYGVVVHLR